MNGYSQVTFTILGMCGVGHVIRNRRIQHPYLHSDSILVVLCLHYGNSYHPTCRSFLQLGAGLSVGFSGLAAGFAIGIVGDSGVRGTAQQPRLFVGMILILIFAEVLGLYGLIVALVLATKQAD